MFRGLAQQYFFLRSLAILGVAAMVSVASPDQVLANEAQRLVLSDGWKPTKAVYWLSDTELLVIAAKRGETGGLFKLMRVGVDGAEADITPLAGEAHCWQPDGMLLFRLGTAAEAQTYGWTHESGLVGPLKEQAALRRCNAWRPEAIEAFETQIGLLEAIERNGSIFAGAIAGGAEEAALVLFSQTDELARWPVAWDFARDVIVINTLHDGGFLIYPSVSAELRAELAGTTSGLPVWQIGADASLKQYQMPWGYWNEVGLYRLVLSAKGLVAAQLRGVRENSPLSGLYSEASSWTQIHAGDLTPESLTVSPEGCRLAWLERGKDEDDKLADIMFREVCTN